MKNKHSEKRSKGAVTIFLTLILVPCIIFTCAFGDVSRVALSKSQAVGAADLALYSLMANYDEELKEWYGLVASCQDIDKFYKVSQDYFVGMMNANGLDGTSSETLVGYLSEARNGKFADFLQVEGLDTVKVQEVKDGALGGNAALIEDGIVEFMKYRGPIVILENLIDRFKGLSSSGAFSGATEASEDEPVIEAKEKYAEAEGDMMSVLLYTYLAIEQYMDYRAANGVPDINKYPEYRNQLDKIFRDFQKMTDTITKYYAATDGIENISQRTGSYAFPKHDLPDTNNLNNEADAIYYAGYTYRMSGIDAKKQEDGSYILDSDAFNNKVVYYLNEHIQNIEAAAGRIMSACSGIDAPTSSNGVNDAVYCMRIQNAINPSDLATIYNDGKALMQMYAKLILANLCVPDPEEGESVYQRTMEIKNAMERIEGIHREYLTYNDSSSDFDRIFTQYKKQADVTVDKVKNYRYQFYSEYYNESVTVGTFLDKVRSNYETLIKHLDKQIANINLILNGGTINYPSGSSKRYTVSSLNTVKQKVIEYSKARDNWGSEAYRHDTEYSRDEQEEYEGAKNGNDLPAALYENGAEAVEVLRTRLTNIRNDMQTLKNALTNSTYGGKAFYTLNRSTAIQAAKTVVPTTVDPTRSAYISLYLSQNESAAQGYHQRLMNEAAYQPPALDSRENGNDPDLKNDPPALYQYLCQVVEKNRLEEAVNEKDAQEEKNKENEKKAKEEAENSKGVDKGFLDDLGIDPVKTIGSNKFGIGSVLTGLVGMVQKIVDGNFDEFRDQLYVCTYIMEMFSYSSYNNEGQYHLSDKPLTLGDYDKGNKRFSEDLQKKWQETDPTKFTDNKTLTNIMINSANNRSNLAEVEYILYGNATNKANLEAAYGSIFLIREALNLVSGFANFYSGSNSTALAIEAIADTVMGLTMGFIPAPLTKVILIGVLATLETARDMQRLKAGTPVVLYKKADNWTYKLPSNAKDMEAFGKIFSGEGLKDSEDTNGLFYSDYLTIFLLIGAGDKNMYSDMLKRVGVLIGGNMGLKYKDKYKEGYDLSKAQCYFQITGDLSVKPLMLDIPLVTNYSGADASGVLELKGWCSYSVKIIRGYS